MSFARFFPCCVGLGHKEVRFLWEIYQHAINWSIIKNDSLREELFRWVGKGDYKT